MTRLATFLSLLAVAGVTAWGQAPQAALLPVKSRYVAAQAFNGTNYSAWSNEISSTNRSLNLAWTPSPTPGTVTLIGSGWSSGHYTQTNCVGTNVATAYPVPVKPAPWFIEWGGEVVMSCTNAVLPCQFFKSYETTAGDWYSISDATNLNGPWNSSFMLLPIGDGTGFTFTSTP